MASVSGIQFDYRQAINQANQLDEIASRIKNGTAAKIESTMSELRSSWTGEAAQSFVDKGIKLSEKVERISRDLENAADTIRSIARRIRDAERAAAAIATKRSY